jgi:general secretion pathway protein M
MAPAPMNPAQGRRTALALLALAALALVLVVALPVWLLHRHYDNALAESADKLDRYSRIAGTRAEVSRQLEAMRAKEPRKFFLRPGAPALSAAEAQEAMRNIVEANGGRLITMQAPTSREEGRYRQISVNVQLTANIFALRKILHAIENNVPYLFVDNLTVRSQVPANYKPPPGAEPEMFVQFDVSGYTLAGSS